jgi:outer membrane lipase/esterase
MHRTAILAAGIAAASAMPAAAATLSDTYSSFLVFGDSLSDPGNLYAATGGGSPASPPYFNGRFSNGPVWAESVTAEFLSAGVASANFAFGGARAIANADGIPDFDAQRFLFATSGLPAGDRPLASVFFGANDLFGAIEADAAAPDAVARIGAAAVSVADAVGAGVRALSASGVGDIVLWNLPDLGRTPLYTLFAPPGVSDLGTFATVTFNTRLAGIADALRAEGIRVSEVDTFSLLNAAISDPAAFGFANTVLPCLFPTAGAAAAFGQPQVCAPATAEGRLFFDAVHPNSVGHALLEADFREIAPIPLPAGGLMLAGALLAFAGLGLRRRA